MMTKTSRFALLLLPILASNAWSGAAPYSEKATTEPPAISGLLKPGIYKKMIEDREAVTYATLDRVNPDAKNENPPKKRYHFYAGVLIHSGLSETKAVLTDYKVYSKIVPYIDRAEFNPKTRLLELSGSFLKFQLRSVVQFTEKSSRWIFFRIVGGHFTGLTGNMYFETEGEKGTAVYFEGEHVGWSWPPSFIIEKGAEIVFGFTARRMRSYVESQKYEEPKKEDSEKSQSQEENKGDSKKTGPSQGEIQRQTAPSVPQPKRRFDPS